MLRTWLRRRRVVAAFASTAVVLLLVFLLGPVIAKPIVRAKIQAEVDQHLAARVEIGSLSWSPLWGATVHDLRLVANDPDDATESFDLLKIDRVAVALSSAPFGDGPIIARTIAIDTPIVRVIETRNGIAGLIEATASSASSSSAPTAPEKISQIFQLHDLKMTNGQIIYEDRATSGSLPMIWRDLTVQVRPADAQSASKYTCIVSAKDGRAGVIESKAAVDVDAMSVQLDHCNARIAFANAASDANSSSLPGALQPLLKEVSATGELIAAIHGTLPLNDPTAAALFATVEIPRATATIVDCPKPLDEIALKLKCQTLPLASPGGSRLMIRSDIERCIARSSDASVQVVGGSIAVNGAGGWGADGLKLLIDPGKDHSGFPDAVQKLIAQFKVTGKLACEITGSGPFDVTEQSVRDVDVAITITPQDMSLHPPQLPLPINDFGEIALRVCDGVATIERVRAGYGDDVFFLQSASLSLADLFKSHLSISAMKGAVTFAKQRPEYPSAIQELMADAQPRGPFWFEGVGRVDLNDIERSLDYDLRITTDRGAISTLRHHIPLLNVNTDVRVTPKVVEVHRFNADVLSGKVSTTGKLKLDDMSYSSQINLRRIDLNMLAQMAVKPGEQPITVTGELDMDAHLAGRGIEPDQAIANITGDGVVQVVRGEFFRVPVFVDIAHAVNLTNLATVGEAAATFRLGDGKLYLLDAAVGAPAIGVRAKGEIDLANDFAMNIDAVANPFSDWDRQVRRDNNPVANVAGAVLGKVQRGLDSVTQEFLYKVHVGGTVAEPKTELIAAPALQGKGK